MGDEIAAERLHFLAGFADDEILADHRADVLEAGARIRNKGIVRLAHDRGRFVAIVLVIYFADDLFDDVLDRHQPVGAAIFVDHQRQVNARGLHLRQEIDRPHRRRHEQQLADDVGVGKRQREVNHAQIKPGGNRLLAPRLAGIRHARARRHERQEVADMNDAFGIVEGFVVNHQPRMRRTFEHAHQFAEPDVALDRDDVGAVDHHVGEAALMQAEDVAQHGALDRRKADLVRRAGIEHHLQVIAYRARLPAEERADRADQPVVGGRAYDLALLYHRRQIARVARIVVGRFGIRHLSRSAPYPHRDRECRVARGSSSPGFPWHRRRRRFRGRSRSDAGNHARPDG